MSDSTTSPFNSAKLIPLTKNQFAIVSNDDFDLLNKSRWFFSKNGYAVGHPENPDETVYMHRFLLNAEKGQVVDHINRDKLDNRRENLRFVTYSQNSTNSQIIRGEIRYKGVHLEDDKYYAAQIKIEGVQHRLGYYSSAIDAAFAYDHASRLLSQDHTCQNFEIPAPQAIAQKVEFLLNGGILGRGKASSYRGAMFDKSRQLWIAGIMVNENQVYLGRYETAIDAAFVYDAASRILHGTEAKVNFPDQEPSREIQEKVRLILETGRVNRGKSQYKGVAWDANRNKWLASICVNGKSKHIGRFNSEQEAALAYNLKASELFGDFATLNIIKDGN